MMQKPNKGKGKAFVSFLFLFFLFQISFARNDSFCSDNIIQVKAHYGFMFSYRTFTHYVMENHFTAYEVTFSKQTWGKRIWEQLYHYPQTGISYWYSGFNQSKFIGQAHGLFPYINFPLAAVS